MQNHVEPVAQIIKSFTRPREAELLLPANEPLDSPLRAVIAEQTERLRMQLKRFAGADALAQFDAEQVGTV